MRRLVPFVLLAALLPGCETVDCTPTEVAAAQAAKVELSGPAGSAVLRARLTSGGKALPGKAVRFDVQADGSTVYTSSAAAGDDGTAALDLKQVDVGALQGLARGNGFRAAFEGDATYCSSSDDAGLQVLR